jgi:hypothetical protein
MCSWIEKEQGAYFSNNASGPTAKYVYEEASSPS